MLLTVLTRFFGFLYPVIVLRELPATKAGLAFFFITTAYFVVQPVSGGPAMALVSPVAAAGDDDTRAHWLRAALSVGLPGVGVCLAIGSVLCLTTSAPLLPMVVIVLALCADALYFQALTALRRYAWAAAYRLIANVAQLAALIVAFAVGLRSVLVVIGIYSASYLAGAAVVETRERAVIKLLRRILRATAQLRNRLLSVAVPTALTGFAYSTITVLDVYLLRLARPGLVATYGAAKVLTSPLLFVSLAVTTIIQPETATLDDDAAYALRRRILLTAAPILCVALLLAIGVAAPVIHLLYGNRYSGAVTAFRWVASGIAVMSLYALLQSWCFGRGVYRKPMMSLATGAGAAVLTNVLLVPIVGAPGAGIGTLVGSGVAFVLLLAHTRDDRRTTLLLLSYSVGDKDS